MTHDDISLNRRQFMATVAAMTAGTAFFPFPSLDAADGAAIRRKIPTTGEKLPVIGMGTSRTFDVVDDQNTLAQLGEVLQAFFDNGGTLIDSSPMYGTAETVVGQLLSKTSNTESLFAATKVWTDGKQSGINQMQQSMQLMGVDTMDLMQIHNLRDWRIHLPTLRAWKTEGKLRYIGITTSHGRYHRELEAIMESEPLDFVQFSYNIEDRAVEERLLPLAADKGIATLINRPYMRGALFSRVRNTSLPNWSSEIDCQSWGQFFLKWIIGHPAVTCVIPATSKLHHMKDNMGAGFGRIPDAKMRRTMQKYFTSL